MPLNDESRAPVKYPFSCLASRIMVLALIAELSGCVGDFTALRPQVDPVKIQAQQTDYWGQCAKAGAARSCALETLQEFGDLAKSAGNFDRDLGYILVGAGTAAAAMSANAHPRSQALKSIAVGVAGLLGIRAVANTDGQRSVLVQAQSVVTCMLRTYDAIDTANQSASTADLQSYMTQLNSFAANLASTNAVTNAASAALVNQQVISNGTAQASAVNLQAAMATAAGTKDQSLAEGVLEVRIYVQNNFNNPATDPSQLLALQQNNVTKQAGAIITAKKNADVNSAVASQVNSLSTGAQPPPQSSSASTVTKAADALQQVYASCNGVQT